MHDRRIDGVAHTFGNYGALFMNAMTWWDHETGSVWSQPWGRSIEGDYFGVELFLLPSQVISWGDWLAAHPSSLAMVNNLDRVGLSSRQGFRPGFVLGLALDGQAKAYYYTEVEEHGLINDEFAGQPIVVWAAPTGLNAYFRAVNGEPLEFALVDGSVTDLETGSTWDLGRGLATAGELQGKALKQVPSTTSFDWAWLDFYPDSTFYTPP